MCKNIVSEGWLLINEKNSVFVLLTITWIDKNMKVHIKANISTHEKKMISY